MKYVSTALRRKKCGMLATAWNSSKSSRRYILTSPQKTQGSCVSPLGSLKDDDGGKTEIYPDKTDKKVPRIDGNTFSNLKVSTLNALPSPQRNYFELLDHKLSAAKLVCGDSLSNPASQPTSKRWENALKNRALVACLITEDSESIGQECKNSFHFGVNHAFHTLVNRSQGTLKGLLKGCAEQNALGAFAAQGSPYNKVKTIYIAADSLCEEKNLYPEQNLNASTVPFPCPECWKNLVQVSDFRHQCDKPALDLYVRCLPDEQNIVSIIRKAKEHAENSHGRINITLVMDEHLMNSQFL